MSPEPLLDLSVRDFLRRLASDAPTPGGGAAAALAAALASSLGSMVCALTVGRPKFAAGEPRVRELATALARAGEMLAVLVAEDAAAYAELSAAFKVGRDDPLRPRLIASAAAVAAAVPLETAATAARVGAALVELRSIGNPNLRADIEAGIHLAGAGLQAAAENVRANLPFMSEADAQRVRQELERIVAAK